MSLECRRYPGRVVGSRKRCFFQKKSVVLLQNVYILCISKVLCIFLHERGLFSHHYFNLYLSTPPSTCSSPCCLTLARHSPMLKIVLRRLYFYFFFSFLFCMCGLGLFSSPSSISAASFQALSTETRQRQEKAVALTYFGTSGGGGCGGLYPNTEL